MQAIDKILKMDEPGSGRPTGGTRIQVKSMTDQIGDS